jgi:hypothetical protein
VAVAGLAAIASRRARSGRVKRDPGLSVLIVSVDTLRADALGCYGRRDARTPWIDRLAAEGVRFETARAHNVVTLPSHANLLSGQYPLRHRVRDNTGFRFPADRATLATILREYQGEVAAADDALGPLLEPFLAASTAERASGSSRPTTASRSEGTARRRTASSLTRRPCACPSSFGRRGSCPRESSAPPSGTSPG